MICKIMTINDDSDNYSKIEKFIFIDAYKYVRENIKLII